MESDFIDSSSCKAGLGASSRMDAGKCGVSFQKSLQRWLQTQPKLPGSKFTAGPVSREMLLHKEVRVNRGVPIPSLALLS